MHDLGFDGLVCDLDGVVYRGDEPVAGAAEAIRRLQRCGVRVIFCTNNSHHTVDQYVLKLRRLGVDVAPADVLTSGVVTAEVIGPRYEGARALVIGGEGIREPLRRSGIEPDGGDAPAVVVVGWDPSFDYDAMRRAARAVLAGATLVATNADATFPAVDGLSPGAGAILASIERATGSRAEVMGKPNPPMMERAAARLDGYDQIAMLGDRPDTDLAGGRTRGWMTILVLSGVTRSEQVAGITPAPDIVLGSLGDLVQ